MGIGIGGNLLFRFEKDLRFFKETTLGKPVLMGRKTWDSLPHKPLSSRFNIILSRKNIRSDGATVIHSKEDVPKFDELFIIGGEEVFRLFLPVATEILLTHVHGSRKADRFFPAFSSKLREVERQNTEDIDRITGQKFKLSFVNYLI